DALHLCSGIGPSPRAWGALLGCGRVTHGRRTIPTCVGSTSGPGNSPGPFSDHPHVRGEHVTSAPPPRYMVGPSPRAWGAPGEDRGGDVAGRTIPTCVGSTVRSLRYRGRVADHPHV